MGAAMADEKILFHPDRPVIHFGSPAGATYYKPEEKVFQGG